jgi:predicted RNA-binding protein with PUA-like domain
MNYWLIKTEADCYSIDDLKRQKKTAWSGVRNFQARNFMRDHMKVGDLALFYHSSSTSKEHPNGVYGVAQVTSKPYADETAFDPKDEHYDKVSDDKRKKALISKVDFIPTWMMVDFSFVEKFPHTVPLAVIKNDPKLEGMMVRQKGSRLSIQPVSEKHFKYIVTIGH